MTGGCLDCAGAGTDVDISNRFVVTGVGSSESHARFLVSLINRCTGRSARYEPLSYFYGEAFRGEGEATLIVFSQGLSSNAQIALKRRGEYNSTVVFTSCTEAGLRAKDSLGRVALLSELEEERATSIVSFPLEDEYSILIRVVGPLNGYLACLEWSEEVLGLKVDRPDREAWKEVIGRVRGAAALERLVDDFIEGVDFNFSNTCGGYAQSLAFKRVEGIFGAQPVLRDLFQYSHGPFQQNSISKHAQWIFATDTTSDKKLVETVLPLFQRAVDSVRIIESPFDEPWAIVYYELLLNRVMLAAIERLEIDQVDWPMKGKDGEAYGLSDFWDG